MLWTDGVSWLFFIVLCQAFVVLAYDCATGAIRCHKSYLKSGKGNEFKELRNSYCRLTVFSMAMIVAFVVLFIDLMGRG